MWFTALILGSAGSLHCIGMCSPLVMAVTARGPILVNTLLYNVGRILMYGVLGMIASTLGIFVHFTQFQNLFSIALGCLLILLGLGSIQSVRIPFVTRLTGKLVHWIKVQFGFFLQQKSPFSILLLGILNGLLPCGLTYLAMSYCLTLEEAWQGFVFMMLFGAATLPSMVGVPWVMKGIVKTFGLSFQRVTTTMLVLLGLLLVTRVYFSGNHLGDPLVNTAGLEIPLCPDNR